MFEEYRQTCQLLADTFGKVRPVDDLTANDFEELRSDRAERWGLVRLGNAIACIKSVFKYGVDNDLIERAPLASNRKQAEKESDLLLRKMAAKPTLVLERHKDAARRRLPRGSDEGSGDFA